MKYRYVGDHAIVTETGVPLAPGDFVELTEEEAGYDNAKDMIESGRLIEADEPQSKSKTKKEES